MNVWGGGIRQCGRRKKTKYVEQEVNIRRAMGGSRKAVTNYCQLRGGKGIRKWWENRIGRMDHAVCPRCGEEEETPDHIVLRCGNIRRVKDGRGE